MSIEVHEQLAAALGDAYTIERELRRGGMSRLFLATDHSLKRPVVIKLLPRELTSVENATRFQREIELAARLHHPNVLTVHAAGMKDGLLYYMMPYVEGESLRQRLDRYGRLRLVDALRILREAVDAISYAHRSGVIHRDIKPENILLDEGHAVVADFGIAYSLTGGERVTGTGLLVGTPGYMAPEQAAGERHIDGRADIYSLAVVGYEMLAGSPPFKGLTAQALLAAHLTELPKPLTDIRPETPLAVCEAIHKALAKSPGDRFRTADEFREAIEFPIAAAMVGATDARWTRPAGFLSRLVGSARGLLRQSATAPAQAPLAGYRVAVLPFSFRGSERLGYLREGIVDLLSTKLDGAANLSVADPNAVLAAVRQSHGAGWDAHRARVVAASVGAARYVLGSLVEAGGRIQASASLYGETGNAVVTALAQAGDESHLFDLIDDLAIQLLVGQETSARTRGGGGVTGLAARTTNSLSALKAYLEGESLLRSGQYTLSKEALKRAVDFDPLFALAWFRLSVAAEWLSDRDLEARAAQEALKNSGRLPDRQREMLQAFVAWRKGSPSAEGMYRNLIAVDPNIVEAWVQLGEVLFHYGPLNGRATSESREAWERVLTLEPDHLSAVYHLGKIASAEGRLSDLEVLTERALALSPQSERSLEARALRAFRLTDTQEQERINIEMQGASDASLIGTTRNIATYGMNVVGAAGLLRRANLRSRMPSLRALAHVQLSYLEVAQGHWRKALDELDSAATEDLSISMLARGYLTSLPFLALSSDVVESTRQALRKWDPEPAPAPFSQNLSIAIHQAAYAVLKTYLLAILATKAGDVEDARRHTTSLEDIDQTKSDSALASALAADVKAQLAWDSGDAAGSLALLDAYSIEVPYPSALTSPFYSQARARFLRAESLAALRRDEEAARWYNSFSEVSVYDLVFFPVSARRRGPLLERLGNPDLGAKELAWANELWSDCDVELLGTRD
ncbi:MAG: protein kinase [Gemmatimonadaceae bacterium]